MEDEFNMFFGIVLVMKFVLDKVNFDILKEFWVDVEEDFMRYLCEFHVLANRLKQVIGKVISDTHCAFVKGRQIQNEILQIGDFLLTVLFS